MKSFKDALLVWNEIVEITEQCEYSQVIGLRNNLFLVVNKHETFQSNILLILKIIYKAIIFPKKINFQVEKDKILFYFPYRSNANLGNLLPVFKEAEHNEMSGTIICTNKINIFRNAIYKEQIYRYTNYYQRITYLFRALKANNNLNKHFRNKQSGSGLNYFANLYQLYVVFLCEIVFEKILTVSKPISIVSTSDYFPIDYALFNTSNRLGIRNYVIQHGIIGIGYYPFTSAKLLVHGKFAKNEMIKKGCLKEKLILAGMPASDMLFKNASVNKETYIEYKDNVKVLILSETQGTAFLPDVYNAYAKELLEIMNENPHIEFIIKLHPAEDPIFYRNHGFKESDRFRILPKQTTLIEAFDIADIAMTIWSTAGLEAMIYGLPLFVIDAIPEVLEWAWWPKLKGGLFWSEYSKNYGRKIRLTKQDKQRIIYDQNIFLSKYFSNQQQSSSFISKILIQ